MKFEEIDYDNMFWEEEETGVMGKYHIFLMTHTPAKIEQQLNAYILGQPELTRAVADFLYYHAMRQVFLSLPMRPLLISGPSGSGKTEVFRVVEKLYGDLFRIKFTDGSLITEDGWSGAYKVSDCVDKDMSNGGIAIIDEFDKLATPKHSSSGDNVSKSIQAQLLKLLEGELKVRRRGVKDIIGTQHMGFVLVGAFEEITETKKQEKGSRIGFAKSTEAQETQKMEYSDQDYIQFGVMPELIGRVATKCTTRNLSEKDYLSIVKNSHSRYSIIKAVLSENCRMNSVGCSDEELLQLIRTSQENRTGVRWVMSQAENKLLEDIRMVGVRFANEVQDRKGQEKQEEKHGFRRAS